MTYARKPARINQAQLIQSHMPLVRKIAWHVHGRVSNAIDVEDLVQIGMVALVEAANGYEDRGHAFSTYAGMRVRGAMIDHLRRHAAQARSGMAKRKELARARVELESQLGRAATEFELAEAMGLDAAAFRELVDAAEAVRHESLDEVYSDQSMWFADLEEQADETFDRERLGEALAEHIAELPEREAMVLQLYFVEELNLEEIGQVLEIGAARVCQIKKSALDKLRVKLAGWR
ncbi:FliA/WhiG family RNA polymerase sigma factor [Sphingomonas sp. PR090111-T3T-6A]|uniref:FliA/WhiG family RNA polymerase sigma factor n=1 Tax=Sphingomonas sp. PR090111-T3T-6A TaxID=685778 RepID=UPI00037CFA9A|nr:FliA/WhiG family RNA polymerase sigma factor [Sphingomonas sp. PR090111-T3T-6A]